MQSPDFSLSGRVALVTGSTQGLGLAIAGAMAAAGAAVVINGRNALRVQAAVESLQEQGYVAHGWVQDIAQTNTLPKAWSALCSQVGTPDIVVNNVGHRLRQPLSNMSFEDIQQHIHVNLTATICLSKLAAAAMVESGKPAGRFITLSSIAGPLVRPGDAVYPIAKQALEALVRSLAVEYGPHGITSNGIAPGTFATEANAHLAADPQKSHAVIGRNPTGRWGRPDEITGAAVFLASPAASYVNGHVLVVDGGFSVVF